MKHFFQLAALLFFLSPLQSFAKTVRYELLIEQKPMNMSGKKEVDFALTVNGGIPAPTLEFTEGDRGYPRRYPGVKMSQPAA